MTAHADARLRRRFERLTAHRTKFVHRAARRESANDREGITVADGTKFDFLGPVPGRGEGRREGPVGDPTGVQRDEVVRTRGPKRESTIVVNGATQSSPRTLGVARRHGDRDLGLDAGDAPQVLGDQCRLPFELRLLRRVLEITAPAPTGMRVATRRFDTFGTRLEDLDRFAAREFRCRLGDLDSNQFTRQSVSHEDDATIIETPDGSPRRGALESNRTRNFVAFLATHHCSLQRRFSALGRDAASRRTFSS